MGFIEELLAVFLLLLGCFSYCSFTVEEGIEEAFVQDEKGGSIGSRQLVMPCTLLTYSEGLTEIYSVVLGLFIRCG